MIRRIAPLLLLVASVAHAATPAITSAAAPDPASAGSLLKVLLGLVAVLGVMAAVAWALRRANLGRGQSGANVKIVGGVSVGSRERIVVVEVGDQWIVVGVASGQVNALSTMPRQENAAPATDTPAPANFSAWLKQTIEKRNEK